MPTLACPPLAPCREAPSGTTRPAPVAHGRRLRIAYLTTEYPKVSHTFVRREIAELERRGHEIVRLSVRPPGGPLLDPADRAEAAQTVSCLGRSKLAMMAGAARGAAVHPVGLLGAARTAARLNSRSDRGAVRHAAYLTEAAFLADRLRRAGVSHVHVHFGTNAAAVALLLKRMAGVTYSLTVHGPGEFDAPVGLSLADKVAGSLFTVAISHFCRAQLTRWVAPGDWDRIHVVRCTVNAGFLAPPPTPAALSRDFVCVGRLTPQKGQAHLLEAFAAAAAVGMPGRLVFAGDGELRPMLRARAETLGVGDRVSITGWLTEAQVREHVLASRAVVLPSAAEGLPVVLMEALALSRPVVTTPVAGIPELVRPGENGWLVPAGDRGALTAALLEAAAASDGSLLALGAAGRARVLAHHHPETESGKLEGLFHRYLG